MRIDVDDRVKNDMLCSNVLICQSMKSYWYWLYAIVIEKVWCCCFYCWCNWLIKIIEWFGAEFMFVSFLCWTIFVIIWDCLIANKIVYFAYGLVNHRQNNYIEIWMAGYMAGCLSLLYCVWVLLGMRYLVHL